MLNVIDEFTRECLAIKMSRKLKALDVIDVLSDLSILRGVPSYIRSDNGPEFVAKARSKTGSEPSEPGQLISNLEAQGRTATARASTQSCATNSLTVRSSSRYEKLRSSSKLGDGTTIRSARTRHSATRRRRQRPCYGRLRICGRPLGKSFRTAMHRSVRSYVRPLSAAGMRPQALMKVRGSGP